MNFFANGVIKDKVRDKVIYDCSIKKVEQINVVVYFQFGFYITVCCLFSYFLFHFQLGDLTGLFGLIMMIMRMLRVKLKVLDISYGTGTGKLV